MVARHQPDSPLVSAAWLRDRLTAPDVRVVDATWFLPTAVDANGERMTGRRAYDAGHIPGARFFDIDEIADLDNPLPHMLPAPEKFSSRVRAMGIGDGHRIVCYDQNHFFAAARVWWMFRVMGHTDVVVLDGGLDAWRDAGGAVEDLPPPPATDRHYTVRTRSDLVRDIGHMRQIVGSGSAQILDARMPGRFAGREPEPRAGVRSGHIPGSLNVPYGDLLDSQGRMADADTLRARFLASGTDLDRALVATCGSGVSAAIIALALAVMGRDNVAIYDGSWSEWGREGSSDPVSAA